MTTLDAEKLNKILPTNLEVFRKLKNMSQYELGAKNGVGKNQAQISHYENGIHEPEREVLEALKIALEFPLDAEKLLDTYDARDFEQTIAA